MAPKIAAKRSWRVKLKAQEQTCYDILKRKGSHVAMSSAEAASTVRKREAPQGGVPCTATAADDAH